MTIIEDVFNPNFEEFDKHFKHVHDWRTYITDDVRKNWDKLSVETRLVAIEVCQEAANREHWD